MDNKSSLMTLEGSKFLFALKQSDSNRFRDFSPELWNADMSRLPEEDRILANKLIHYIIEKYSSRPYHRHSALKKNRSDGDHIFKTVGEDLYWCVIQPFKKGNLVLHFHDKNDLYKAPGPFAAKWCEQRQGQTGKKEKDIVLAGKVDLLPDFLPLLDQIHDNAVIYYGRTKDSTESLRQMFGEPLANRPRLPLPDNEVFSGILLKEKGCRICQEKQALSLVQSEEGWFLFCDNHHPQPSKWILTAKAVIPHDVKEYVWHRDLGCCRKCGSKKHLHYDHVIPRNPIDIAIAGSNTENNIQLKCQSCNLAKGNKLIR